MAESKVTRALFRVTVSDGPILRESMGGPDVTTQLIVADNMTQAAEYALSVISARGKFVRQIEFMSFVVVLPRRGGAQ